MALYDVLVIGAGLCGASAARRLADRGRRVLVLEKQPFTGGMAAALPGADGRLRSLFGAHIFHTHDRRVWDFARRFASFEEKLLSPMALSQGELLCLPFNMNTFFQLFGARSPAQARARIEAERLKLSRPPENLEEAALSRLGPTIYGRLVKGYTEKHWGRPAHTLPPGILGRLPLRFSYDNRYFSAPFQGLPRGGYTALTDAMLRGIELRLDTDYFADRAFFDRLAPLRVYTGPLDEYFAFAQGPLGYRSLAFKERELGAADWPYRGLGVLNFSDPGEPAIRAVDQDSLCYRGPVARHRLCFEYPMAMGPGLAPLYPIPDGENLARRGAYLALAAGERDTRFLGRLGCYRYLDMDQAMAMGMEV